VTKTTKGVLSGVAVAALAATGVAAAVRYRLGHQPSAHDRAGLDELATRLSGIDGSDWRASPGRVGRMLDTLQRSQGITVNRLHHWIAGVRDGTLTPEQATAAESDFGILEREADRDGL